MRVADGAGECVCRVSAGIPRQPEQPAYHFLYLLLARMAIADHGLLDLQGGIFRHRQSADHGRADGRTARLAQQQRGLGIDVDEHLLDGHLLRLELRDDLRQAFEDGADALG